MIQYFSLPGIFLRHSKVILSCQSSHRGLTHTVIWFTQAAKYEITCTTSPISRQTGSPISIPTQDDFT